MKRGKFQKRMIISTTATPCVYGRGLLCYIIRLGTFHDLITNMTRKTATLFLCPYDTTLICLTI